MPNNTTIGGLNNLNIARPNNTNEAVMAQNNPQSMPVQAPLQWDFRIKSGKRV